MKLLYEKDADSSAWRYYQKIYSNIIEIDLETILKNKSDRLSGTFILNENKLLQVDKKYSEKICVELSGECLFNFNDKKHILFSDVITYSGATDEAKDEARKKLKDCEAIFNSPEIPWNFVLMPVQGALNNVKGNIYYSINNNKFVLPCTKAGKRFDRPDTFVCFLDEFYQVKDKKFNLKEAGEFLSSSIFSYSLRSFNFSQLYDFMNQFESTEQFCRIFWGLDSEFIDRMRQWGKIPLDSDKSMKNSNYRKMSSIEVLMEYMKMAEDYWDLRKTQFNEIE